MAVSSANVSGRPPAVDADEARSQLGDLVDVYLDAGPSAAAGRLHDRRPDRSHPAHPAAGSGERRADRARCSGWTREV